MPRLNPSICNPRALFIDLSGTIHIEDKVVPQSIEAINALKQSNVPHLFVTNTSKVCKGYQKVLFLNGGLKNHFMYISSYLIQESTIRLHTRLSQLGFDIKKEKIFSSLSAAKAVVAERQLNPLLILEEAAKEVIKNVKLFC